MSERFKLPPNTDDPDYANEVEQTKADEDLADDIPQELLEELDRQIAEADALLTKEFDEPGADDDIDAEGTLSDEELLAREELRIVIEQVKKKHGDNLGFISLPLQRLEEWNVRRCAEWLRAVFLTEYESKEDKKRKLALKSFDLYGYTKGGPAPSMYERGEGGEL